MRAAVLAGLLCAGGAVQAAQHAEGSEEFLAVCRDHADYWDMVIETGAAYADGATERAESLRGPVIGGTDRAHDAQFMLGPQAGAVFDEVAHELDVLKLYCVRLRAEDPDRACGAETQAELGAKVAEMRQACDADYAG